jgi:predicted anti-sigma-YlaC factor YlaD
MDNDKKYTHQALILIGSLFVALLFDLLFYKKPIGVSLGIFTTALVIATLTLVRIQKIQIDLYSLFLGACAIGLSFLTTFRSSSILTTLNVVVVFLTYSLFVGRLSKQDLGRFTLFNYLVLPFGLLLKSLGKSFFIIKDLPSGHSELSKSPLARQIARGSLYALPMMLLFLWLFSSADLVFKKYIFNVADFFKNFDFAVHIPLITIVSLLIAGLAYLILQKDSQTSIKSDEHKALIITKILSTKKPVALLLLPMFAVLSLAATFICIITLSVFGFNISDQVANTALFTLPVSLIVGYVYLLYRYKLSGQPIDESFQANKQFLNGEQTLSEQPEHRSSSTDKTQSCNDFSLGGWQTGRTEKADNVITCKLRYFTWIETSIILGSICLVSLAFVYLQFTYLFNGNASISAQGFTYAQYAHRGFFELLAASLFSFVILCFTSNQTVTTSRLHSGILKSLSVMLIGLVAVIMVSAYKRLDIYEMAYGFTILRVYTQLFIILLGFVFLALLAKIAANRNMPWLSVRIIAIAVLFIVWINAYNPDQVIAKRNLEQYKTAHKHDVLVYNTSLSADAIDEIIVSNNLLSKETNAKDHFTDSLQNLKKRKRSNKDESWMSYNLAKQHEIIQIELSMEK